LQNPELVSLALEKKPGATAFTDYVSLSLSSSNNAWSSLPVCAILAPNLCTDILLNLPFLSRNKIVIDHDLRTAIHKPTGFDLLNESSFIVYVPLPKKSPKFRRNLIVKHRKIFLRELKMTCAQRLLRLESKNYFDIIKPYNPISAIKDAIIVLASKQRLLELETSLKSEFKPLFQPIPHVKELPTNETAQINLKNAYDTIKNHTYS
jgi:hypothetical protein